MPDDKLTAASIEDRLDIHRKWKRKLDFFTDEVELTKLTSEQRKRLVDSRHQNFVMISKLENQQLNVVLKKLEKSQVTFQEDTESLKQALADANRAGTNIQSFMTVLGVVKKVLDKTII